MKDIDDIRFASIKANFRDQTNVQRGYEMFMAYRYKKGKLKWLLRHHKQKGIYKHSEVMFRDDIDFLIAYYSVLMAAVLTGYLSPLTFNRVRDEALLFLDHKDVKTYYKLHYPLTLPALFLKCVKNDIKNIELSQYLSPSEPPPGYIFEDFLQLYRARMDDGELDVFLFMLDNGGYYNKKREKWINIKDILSVLSKKKKLMDFNNKKHQDKYIKLGISGFSKFINYLIDLSRMMKDHSPLYQSSLWHLDSYWFNKISTKRFEKIMDVFTSIEETIKSGYQFPQSQNNINPDTVDPKILQKAAITEIDRAKQAMSYIKNPALELPFKNIVNKIKEDDS